MVLDSSAIIAIELREPGFERLLDKIGDAKAVVIGVPTMFETAIVLSRRRGQALVPGLEVFSGASKQKPFLSRRSTWTRPLTPSSDSDAAAIPPH